VLAYPEAHINPYHDLFYGALKPCGIDVTFTQRVDREIVQSTQWDVIHLHWSIERIWRHGVARGRSPLRAIADWWMLLRDIRRNGVRIVWTAHELSPPDDRHWTDVLGYAICAHAAHLCICHGSLARRDLIRRFGVRPRKILSMPIGTYSGVLPPPRAGSLTRERLGVPADARLLLCFGGLRPRKGVEVALRAAALLSEDHVVVVAGDAASVSLRPWTERLARTYASPNTRVLLQRLDTQALADLLAAADCVLLPYLHIYGSSTLSLSLACGRAVVASALPYFSELLSLEPDAGVLAAPGDPQALARAVREFFSKPVAERHAAAARLGTRLEWATLIAPVAEWLDANAPRASATPEP
jgi:glycosyltransferase involved in cell wall biosynthesis